MRSEGGRREGRGEEEMEKEERERGRAGKEGRKWSERRKEGGREYDYPRMKWPTCPSANLVRLRSRLATMLFMVSKGFSCEPAILPWPAVIPLPARACPCLT